MKEFKPLRSKKERLKHAQTLEEARVTAAYAIYAKAIDDYADCYYYVDNTEAKFNDFDTFMKGIKGALGARCAAATKAAKGTITLHYIYKMSQDATLGASMSTREVDEACKFVGGSSVQKTLWSGWFKGRDQHDRSPYFTDENYRAHIHSHALLSKMQSELNELNEILNSVRLTRQNPYQKQIEKSIDKLFQRS